MLWNYKSTARGSGKKHKYVGSKQQATKNQLGQGRHKKWGQNMYKKKREWQYIISKLQFKNNVFENGQNGPV